jgi:hypothetical protein
MKLPVVRLAIAPRSKSRNSKSNRGASFRRQEALAGWSSRPSASSHDRVHDGPQFVAGDPAILHPRRSRRMEVLQLLQGAL